MVSELKREALDRPREASLQMIMTGPSQVAVFSTPELLHHIAKRVTTKQDVCSLRAVNTSAAKGIDCHEAQRLRDAVEPHICLEMQYNVVAEIRDAEDDSVICKNFAYIQLCIAEQPAHMLTRAIKVNVNDSDIKKVWLKHMTDAFKDEGHGHLDITGLECVMFLDYQASDDVAMRLLNTFTQEVLDWKTGTFVLKKVKDVRTSLSVLRRD